MLIQVPMAACGKEDGETTPQWINTDQLSSVQETTKQDGSCLVTLTDQETVTRVDLSPGQLVQMLQEIGLTMVKVKTKFDRFVWINPKHVSLIKKDEKLPIYSVVSLTDWSNMCYVEEDAYVLAGMMNEALRRK